MPVLGTELAERGLINSNINASSFFITPIQLEEKYNLCSLLIVMPRVTPSAWIRRKVDKGKQLA